MKAQHTFENLKNLVLSNAGASIRKPLLDFLDHPLVGSRLAAAPASGKLAYHHAYPGGMVDHIMEVFYTAKAIHQSVKDIGKGPSAYSDEDILLVAILHDIHKIGDTAGHDYYVPNILKSGKQSDAVPYEHGDEYQKIAATVKQGDTPVEREAFYMLEHGLEKVRGGTQSLAFAYAVSPTLYSLLSEDVKFAIKYHDGAYGTGGFEMGGKENQLQVIMHCADMWSSRFGVGARLGKE